MSNVIYGQPITFGGNTKAPAIFGDGSDGVAIISADTQWLAETEDTGMIVKNFKSLTISEGVTVSAGNRNCGMIVRVKGDCFINGTLANKLSCKSILDSDGVDFSVYPLTMQSTIAGNGGDGGAGGKAQILDADSVGGAGGTGMTGRFYGGGWSAGGGAGGHYYYNGDVGVGSGEVGGAGGSTNNLTTAVLDSEIFVPGSSTSNPNGTYGGGGFGYQHGVGGSRGADGTSPTTQAAGYGAAGGGGGNYGGGVIILFVGGNLVINGTIDCSGGNGGNGGKGQTIGPQYVTTGAGGGGAGGAGGGRIFICHKGTIENNGTLNVNGGTAGAAGSADGTAYVGTAGTAGTIGTTAVKTYEQYMEEDVA